MTDADFMSSVKHWTKTNGEPVTYGDATDTTPVPRVTYRCKAVAKQRSDANKQVFRTHTCKLTVDHDGDHKCLCGRTFERTEA